MEPGEQCDDGNTVERRRLLQPLQARVRRPRPSRTTPRRGERRRPAAEAHLRQHHPGPDQDYFTSSSPRRPTFGSRPSTAPGPGNCASPLDSVIRLYGPDGTTQLATDDEDGINSCSLINATNDVGARQLAPGTYVVRYEDFLTDTAIPAYMMQIQFTAVCGNGVVQGFEECDGGPTCDANCARIPVCGDGFVDAPETCDDSNTTAGDGCSSTCQVEGVTFEVEPNDTTAQADAVGTLINADVKISGAIGVVDDQDVFRIELASPSVVRFETFDSSGVNCLGGMTTVLTLLNSGGGTVVSDTSSGIELVLRAGRDLAAGVHYIRVNESGNNATIATYVLEANIQADAGAEVEPNESTADPDALPGTEVFILGGHQVNLDLDTYAITVPAGGSIRAEVIEGGAETCESNGVDSWLTLFSSTGTILVTDDDDGRGFCSQIDGTGSTGKDAAAHNLAAGTYYLQVRACDTCQTGVGGQFDYRLQVTVRAP